MKAAIVLEAGKTPVYGDFKEPVLGNGEVRVGGVRAGFFSAIAGTCERHSPRYRAASPDLLVAQFEFESEAYNLP